MSLPLSTELWTKCPNCKLPLRRNVITCHGCGCVLPLERAQGFLTRKVRSIHVRFSKDREERLKSIVWLLALIPIFVLPPLVSLVLVAFLIRKDRNRAGEGSDLIWPVLMATFNILVSIVLLLKLRHEAVLLLQYLQSVLETGSADRGSKLWNI